MSKESVAVRLLAGFEVELLRTESLRQSFGKHTHDAVSIGVIDKGVGEFWCRGATHRVPPDSVVLFNPGEVHTGGVARGHESIAYRMTYIPFDALQELLPDSWHPFSAPAVHAPDLAAMVRDFHDAVSAGRSQLECESALCELLSEVSLACGDRSRVAKLQPGAEASRMAQARDFIHANVANEIPLRRLANVVNLTPSYLSRLFRAQYGLPPHAYQLQLRLRAAKTMLAFGSSLSTTAVSLGFVDQAHFTYAFKRSFGVTPGRYQRGVMRSCTPNRGGPMRDSA